MGIFSSLLSLGTSFAGSMLAQKQQKREIRRARISGVLPARGRIPEPGGGFRRPKQPTAIGPPIPPQFGRASTVPAWHQIVHDFTAGKKKRRMNVLNYSALKRSLRRLEGFQRTVKRVEKAIPTKPSRRRAQTAAQAHHAR